MAESRARVRDFGRYLWAAPATAVGLVLAALACALGAKTRLVGGVLEVAGGRTARLAARSNFVAITFGHVVLGLDGRLLEEDRAHEHAHVRQYERWGIFFFPLYLLSSAIQLARGRRAYRDNAFEREGCAVAAAAERPASRDA